MKTEDLLEEYEDSVRGSVSAMDKDGLEHGFSICGDTGNTRQTGIDAKGTTWIDLEGCQSDDSVYVNVHTHPSGNIGLSKNDWKSLLTTHMQYPEDTKLDGEIIRGSCVAGERLGEETPTVKCVTVTDKARNLTVDQQVELSQDILTQVNKDGVGMLGLDPTNEWDDLFDETYHNFS